MGLCYRSATLALQRSTGYTALKLLSLEENKIKRPARPSYVYIQRTADKLSKHIEQATMSREFNNTRGFPKI